jgi:nucleotide sugar dehydrogenase
MREKITIVGCGKLGLCVALCFDRKGFDVLGVDVNPHYTSRLNNGTLESHEPQVEELLQAGNLHFTTELHRGIWYADTIYIYVDTPNRGGRNPYDTGNLGTVLQAINDIRAKGKDIVIGCTVMPGYTERVGKFLIRDCEGCTLSYSPEFIRQGEIIESFCNPDVVLIGTDELKAHNKIRAHYKALCENEPGFHLMRPLEAEIAKLALNCAITCKISLANNIGDVCVAAGADPEAVLASIGCDSRIGPKCFRYGYGFGGPCFPRDNRAFAKYAKSVAVEPTMFEAADRCNDIHAVGRASLAVYGKPPVYEDVTFKPNCGPPIIEESQKLEEARILATMGATVTIRDRPEVIREVQKEYGSLFKYEVKE